MSAYDPAFDAAVSAGPIVDMVGDGRMEYDGPRCAADCGTAVDEDGLWCEPCEDSPHAFQHDGSRFDFCVCGRIRAARLHDSEGDEQ